MTPSDGVAKKDFGRVKHFLKAWQSTSDVATSDVAEKELPPPWPT